MAFQNWKARSQEFRKKNYLPQNSQGTVRCSKKREYAWRMSHPEFVKNPMGPEYLTEKMHSAKLCSRSTGL